MRLPRRLIVAAFAAAALSTVFASGAAGSVNQALCHGNSPRITVPSDYAIDACFNGSQLIIKNTIQLVFSVSRTGDIGNPSRQESDHGFAASAERQHTTDPNILLRDDALIFPVGPGGGSVTINPSATESQFYAKGALVGSVIPGHTSDVGQAGVDMITELNDDYAQFQQCLLGKNWLGQLGCKALLERNVTFAVTRAAAKGGAGFIQALAGKIIGAVLTAWDIGKTFEDGVSAVARLEHTHTTIRIAAASGSSPGALPGGGRGGGGAPSSPSSVGGGSLSAGQFTVQNASSGTYWRSGPDWNTAESSSGNGFYPGTVIAVLCYQAGAGNVPGSSDQMWEQASWVSGPGHGSGWINEHFINDGSPTNQPSPGIPACQSSSAPAPTPSAAPSPTPTSAPPPTSAPAPTSAPPPTTAPPLAPSQPPTPSPASPQTWSETAGGNAHTWTDYTNAGGNQGPAVPGGQNVQIACRVQGFRVADGNTWWYRIASSPWNGDYYVSADAFYNNGQTSGSLHGTPFVDPVVAGC